MASTTIFARDGIRTYTVPKEIKPSASTDTVPPMAQQPTSSQSMIVVASIPRNGKTWFFKLKGDPQTVETAKPAFQEFLKSVEFTDSGESPAKWKAPAGWEEQPAGNMVLGSFSIPGKDGSPADVTVTSFPGDVGGEASNVDRWRRQVGLPPATEPPQSQPVTVGGVEGKLYVIGGGAAAGANPHGGVASAPVEKTNPHTAASADAGPQMDVPTAWKEKAPGPMVLKSYSVSGSKGGNATVSITSFPGDVGGRLMNINRWRKQLSQPEIDESQVNSASQNFENGYLVDLEGTDVKTGKPARLIAAAIPHEGNTWFYKLLGDKATVEESKDAFLKFVKSVRY